MLHNNDVLHLQLLHHTGYSFQLRASIYSTTKCAQIDIW